MAGVYSSLLFLWGFRLPTVVSIAHPCCERGNFPEGPSRLTTTNIQRPPIPTHHYHGKKFCTVMRAGGFPLRAHNRTIDHRTLIRTTLRRVARGCHRTDLSGITHDCNISLTCIDRYIQTRAKGACGRLLRGRQVRATTHLLHHDSLGVRRVVARINCRGADCFCHLFRRQCNRDPQRCHQTHDRHAWIRR